MKVYRAILRKTATKRADACGRALRVAAGSPPAALRPLEVRPGTSARERALPGNFRLPLTHQFNLVGALGFLPALLLAAALSSVFWFGHDDRGYFYRSHHDPQMELHARSIHDWASAKNLTLAANLSWRSGFRLFLNQRATPRGTKWHHYGSFPVGGYVLIKLAILPFAEDLAAMTLAARMLMLALFCAAALLAYDAIAKVTGSRWVAVTAVALAFSSYYCLFHNDAVDNEGSSDLFAVMLAFHGMVAFARGGRLRQLLVKTAIAVFLGWHVFAFLLPFVAVGLCRDALRAGGSLRGSAVAAARSPFLAVGCWALAIGLALLAFNVLHQYFAHGGNRPLARLQVIFSALNRAGLQDAFLVDFQWWDFLQTQFQRIGQLMALPYVLAAPLSGAVLNAQQALVTRFDFFAVFGMVATACAFAGAVAALVAARRRGSRRPVWLLGVLAVSGFCWALPMRGNTGIHDYECLFYIGLTLVLFSSAAWGLRQLCGRRLVVCVAVLAAGSFAWSAHRMGLVGHDAAAAERQRALARDFEAIRRVARGGKNNVCVSPRWSFRHDLSVSFYLAGSNLVYTRARPNGKQGNWCRARALDFDYTLSHQRQTGGEEGEDVLLTPTNEIVFLHTFFDLEQSVLSEYRAVVAAEPLFRSTFDGYYKDGRLHLVQAPCGDQNMTTRFWLAVFPPRPLLTRVLPPHRQRFGSLNTGAALRPPDGLGFDGKCMVSTAVPAWAELVTVGQIGEMWRGFARIPVE